jgi:hypothetical protein
MSDFPKTFTLTFIDLSIIITSVFALGFLAGLAIATSVLMAI